VSKKRARRFVLLNCQGVSGAYNIFLLFLSEQFSSSSLRGLMMVEQVLRVVNLKHRSDIHWARKIWHMGGVSVIAYLYAHLPEKTSLILLSIAWLAFVPIDFMRLKNPALNDFVLSALRPIMRRNEVDKLAGTTYLISGVTLVAFVFPPQIVLLTMIFLAFADPIASYWGIRFGKDKIFGEKSLQGSLAAFFVCSVATFYFLTSHWLLMDRLVIVSLLGGVIGALAELIPIGKLDDNFTLPVLSASALWCLFTIFGAFSSYT
jgi:diacylglycerol kinase (CTP)